eukprot:TRINITY_DN4167_c0_g1_i1.p1 TRINITY_DN4167_c0_g1~~TRINITY_DN4167_c0_g1_i1.p1  ORF type:complete len:445 (-),score=51.91 TRINITY_DN4167_c0_g1_i1:746-2080(-)
MGCIVGCLASSVLSCASTAVSKAMGRSIRSRFIYAFLLMLSALVAWTLSNLPVWVESQTWLDWLASHTGLNLCEKDVCFGTMAVYRVTCALALFHLVMSILLFGVKSTKDPRSSIQDSWWIIKIPCILLLFVVSVWIPNTFFVYWAYLALVGASCFILIQLVLLVDFAHSWNESWVGYYEDTNSRFWAVALLGSTVFLYLSSITASVLMYVYFTNNASVCWMNSMFVTLNAILCFAVTMFSIHPRIQEKNHRSGILQSAVVTIYCTYLIWSSLSSEPQDMECSKLKSPEGASLFFGVAFTFVAVVYSAIRVSSSGLSTRSENDDQRELLKAVAPLSEDDLEDPVGINSQVETSESSDVGSDQYSYNLSFFHITFFMAALYLAMVLTNWKTVIVHDVDIDHIESSISVDQGMASVWTKAISSWVTFLIYIWTIVAPVLYPNREFV